MTGALHPTARRAADTLRQLFGVDLAKLPLELDTAFVEQVRGRVQAASRKPLRILLLSNSMAKYQEKAVLHFFNAVGLGKCDCICFDRDHRSLRPKLRNVAYRRDVSEVLGERYDFVLSFDANQLLPAISAAVGAPGVHLGTVRENLASEESQLPASDSSAALVQVYSTMARTLPEERIRAGLGGAPIRARAAIDFPPNVELYYATPDAPTFPYVVLGGGDRDYAFLHDARDLFDAPVVVTSAEHQTVESEYISYSTNHLDLLRNDDQFACLPWLREELYLTVLLHARVVILPLLGDATTDYTSIADAIWYGKPVLTTRVQANAHLDDRVLFFAGKEELGRRIHELAEPSYYREVCERTRARAREKNSLYELMLTLHGDLCGESPPRDRVGYRDVSDADGGFVKTGDSNVMLRVPGACNLSCSFCRYGKSMPTGDPDAERRELERQIDAAIAAGAEHITWGEGDCEPTTFPRFEELVRYAREHGVRRQKLLTNGVLTSDEAFVGRLRSAGLTELVVALVEHDAATAEALCGDATAGEKKIATLKNCRRFGIQVQPHVLLMRANYQSLGAILEYYAPHLESEREVSIELISHGEADLAGAFQPPLSGALVAVEATAAGWPQRRFGLIGVPECIPGSASGSPPNLRRWPAAHGDYASACEGCGLRRSCGGLPSGYVALYGEEELHGDRVVERPNDAGTLREQLVRRYSEFLAAGHRG